MKRRGSAQIPLMIGLLLMAIAIPVAIKLVQNNQDTRNKAAYTHGCVEACPNSGQKDLLQNCTPPESDGSSKDSLCNKIGRVEPCGGKQYCCPSVGGTWTLDMAKCPSEITPTPTVPPTGDDPVLNFKVSFGDVKVADAKCAVDWPLSVIVLSGGETKVYTDIKVQPIDSSENLVVYKGSLVLTGFNHLENVAVFIKGPKHLQMKYAIQSQSGSYDKAGGELVLTKSADTSVLYDFSKYPMLPGDVVGASVDDGPNGEINGVDFSYVKNRPNHETVAEGGYLKADLDGNCQVNTNDVNVLKISLQTKQGELY